MNIITGNEPIKDLTIRQLLTGLAMCGLCFQFKEGDAILSAGVAENAADIADATIKELNKRSKKNN